MSRFLILLFMGVHDLYFSQVRVRITDEEERSSVNIELPHATLVGGAREYFFNTRGTFITGIEALIDRLKAVCDNHSAHANPKKKCFWRRSKLPSLELQKAEVSNSTWLDGTRPGYVEPLH